VNDKKKFVGVEKVKNIDFDMRDGDSDGDFENGQPGD
jgi:hypothetical protein